MATDDLMCFICLDFPDDPTIVCKCSKVCCNKCIKEWIGKNSSCPMCRSLIGEASLIKCKWISEVICGIEDMRKSNKELKQINNHLTEKVKNLEGKLNKSVQKSKEFEKRMEGMDRTISVKEYLNKLEFGNNSNTGEVSNKLKRASAKLMNQALSVFEKLERDENVSVESLIEMERLTDEVNGLKLNL